MIRASNALGWASQRVIGHIRKWYLGKEAAARVSTQVMAFYEMTPGDALRFEQELKARLELAEKGQNPDKLEGPIAVEAALIAAAVGGLAKPVSTDEKDEIPF